MACAEPWPCCCVACDPALLHDTFRCKAPACALQAWRWPRRWASRWGWRWGATPAWQLSTCTPATWRYGAYRWPPSTRPRLELLIRLYLSQQQPRQDEQQEPVAAGQVAQPAAAAAAAPPPVASAARFQKQAAAGVAALPTPAELAGADPVFHQPVVCIGTPLRKLVQQHGDQLGQILQQQGHHQQQQNAADAAAPAEG